MRLRVYRDEKSEGVVLELAGKSSADIAGSDGHILEVDARIPTGATVVSGADARVDLSILPGALLRLDPDSALRIEKLTVAKNGNRTQEAMQRDARLTLPRGAVTASVQFRSEGDWIGIATPNGTVSATSAALFFVDVDTARTRVTCARGTVHFQPSEGSPISLHARSFAEWPRPNEQVSADFDVRATEEIEKLFEVERKLLGLETARRLAPTLGGDDAFTIQTDYRRT